MGYASTLIRVMPVALQNRHHPDLQFLRFSFIPTALKYDNPNSLNSISAVAIYFGSPPTHPPIIAKMYKFVALFTASQTGEIVYA